jgi:acylphosphatase
MDSNLASVQITIYGNVQGVFFRDFASKWARKLGLTGYVRNLTQHAAVEVRAEGERENLKIFINQLENGPPTARVTGTDLNWSEYTDSYSDFRIRY